MHYNYFRDYDPRIGRYVESDPIGLNGGINTYAYAYSNALGYVDPRGLKPVPCPPGLPPDAKCEDGLGNGIERRECDSPECRAGLQGRLPSDLRSRETLQQQECEFICGLTAPGPVVPASRIGFGKYSVGYVFCKWFCSDPRRRGLLCS